LLCCPPRLRAVCECVFLQKFPSSVSLNAKTVMCSVILPCLWLSGCNIMFNSSAEIRLTWTPWAMMTNQRGESVMRRMLIPLCWAVGFQLISQSYHSGFCTSAQYISSNVCVYVKIFGEKANTTVRFSEEQQTWQICLKEWEVIALKSLGNRNDFHFNCGLSLG